MLRKYIIIVLSLVILLSGCSDQLSDNSNNLFPKVTFDDNVKDSVKLSDIFNDSKVIQLSTSDSTLISSEDIKVLKRDGKYYIKSINEIFIFNGDGGYISTLSRIGNGPGEYVSISDFDVVDINGDKEIWIAALQKILRYKADNLEYTGEIVAGNFVNQFCVVNDSTILITTNEDKYFRVIDMKGVQRNEFFDVDFPNSLQKQHSFKRNGKRITYQFANTIEAMVYDPTTDKFFIEGIFPDNGKFQTIALGQEFYQKYDMRFASKLNSEYAGISSYKVLGDMISIITVSPGNRWKLTVGSIKGKTLSYAYFPLSDSVIVNDLLNNPDPMLLTTQACCDSDDSFMFIDCMEEDKNPRVLEVMRLK